jgi:hypothetical protein
VSPAVRTLLRDPALLAVPVLAWALIAPFLFGFDEPDALGFRFPLAFAAIPLALLAPGLRPAAALVALGGALLAIAPFAFGYTSAGPPAWLSDPLSGAAILAAGVLSASNPKSGASPAATRRGPS